VVTCEAEVDWLKVIDSLLVSVSLGVEVSLALCECVSDWDADKL